MVKKKTQVDNLICVNRQARYHYHIEKSFEAGLVLLGWEVKCIRAARCQLKDSYITVRDHEAWLVNAHISPISTVSTHCEANPIRPRKLLLKHKEIKQLIGAVQQQGYSIVPLKLYWIRGQFIKVEIALAKGKKLYDKRASEREKTLKKEAWRR
ncbi:MAG: SsrA-binding protein [Legionellales bacterium]|nr:SsrA-binding protein [Legionellales bacterium]|tara:strand:- start:494 stop:955 length:462 start_codon:yes stop_codon:yes gene_type:complete